VPPVGSSGPGIPRRASSARSTRLGSMVATSHVPADLGASSALTSSRRQMDIDLRSPGERYPQEIQRGKANMEQRREGMLDRGVLRRDPTEPEFSQLVYRADGPERSPLRVGAMRDLEAGGLAMADQAIP